jgi:tetratricopeptide (TPR) repeat protein
MAQGLGVMKWIMYVVLGVLLFFSWRMYQKTGDKMAVMQQEILAEKELDDPEGKVAKMESDLNSLEGEKTFNGILLTFLGAGLVGIFFVVHALPFFAQRLTHAVFDSAEMVEKDPMHDARSLIAQGDYEGAIEALKLAATAEPLNRLPWMEISKIQRNNLEDPAGAIQTIRHALESQAWEVNDAAFFMFRLAELYDEAQGDRASAISIMNQVIEQFPETRHSANASHKLHEWNLSAVNDPLAAEEAEFLRKQRENS